MPDYAIDTDTLVEFLVGLLNTPSPTGYHEQAITYCEAAFSKFPLGISVTRKGAMVATWEGSAENACGLTAHIDTLGAMVAEIKSNGRLKLTQLGGWAWGSVEGEGVTIHALSSGKALRGTILPTKASVHIYGSDARDFKREADQYEVRLDVKTSSAQETRSAGVEVGDFVSFDPRVEVGGEGFVRSRHLDDKASVACVYAAIKALADAGLAPNRRTTIHISNYEEVGHGAATGFPADLAELVTVDMAAAGGPQNSDEFSVGICVKDNGGPYHIETTRKLIALAQAAEIPYKTDTYPYYGSDGEAYWRAGGDVRVGLIGPGVDASHHYERTHIDSMTATARLIAEYLLKG